MNLSFACSLRMGEILGLTWENVHISDEDIAADNAYGYIDKELTRASKRAIETLGEKDIYYIFTPLMPNTSTRIILKKPKTDSSIRKVWLPKTLAYILREWKKSQDELKGFLGDEYQDFDLVVALPNGRPCEDRIILKEFAKLREDAGLPKVVFHSLRHSSTTYKLKLNHGDLKATQGDTGHAEIDMITSIYVEDKGIKTVIIASEDNIKDEENYKTFKEKVVERTVKLDVEYRRIQQEMIGNYKAKTSEYTEFLKTESPKLFQVFEESETRNLRTFKSCLIDFERVYELWCRLKLPTDGMGGALYVFAAYLFEVKGGNYKKLNEYDEYTFNFLERTSEDKKRKSPPWQTIQDDENSKYKRYNAQYRIQPLIRWMIEGEWDEQRIKTALRQRFSVKETAPEREVLDKAFWELSQEIIDRGLPQVLQQAYDGKLTTDDYVALLGRLDDFRKIGVPIQCDVDDARMIQGFHNRKAKIIKGDICEERGHRRLMRDEEETRLTPQEQTLNKEIEKFQDQWPYLMNEIFFMDYLKNPTYEKGLAAKSIVLVCFDDELLTAFVSAYKEANISEQQEMLTTLKEISFRGGVVERDETDIETTRKNFEELENALHSEAEHANDAVKKFYANRHLEVVKQIRQKL